MADLATMYDKMKNEPESVKGDSGSGGDSNPSVPISFLYTPGRYIFRFWALGEDLPFRIVDGHILKIKDGDETLDFGRYEKDDRIEDLVSSHLKTLDVALDRKGWLLKARRFYMLMVRVLSAPESDKYVKAGSDTVLILDKRYIESLIKFFATTSKEDFAVYMDSTKSSAPVYLDISKASDGKGIVYNWSLGDSAVDPIGKEPKMPDGVKWEGLDKVWIPKGVKMSDDKFFEFKKKIVSLVESADGGPVGNGSLSNESALPSSPKNNNTGGNIKTASDDVGNSGEDDEIPF